MCLFILFVCVCVCYLLQSDNEEPEEVKEAKKNTKLNEDVEEKHVTGRRAGRDSKPDEPRVWLWFYSLLSFS